MNIVGRKSISVLDLTPSSINNTATVSLLEALLLIFVNKNTVFHANGEFYFGSRTSTFDVTVDFSYAKILN